MRKIIFISLTLLVIHGCQYTSRLNATENESKAYEFQPIEMRLSDFSKKITGHYGTQGIPQDFDGNQFIEILKKEYPDQAEVNKIEKYAIKVRAIGRFYSVMLCDRSGTKKIMEDLSCDMAKVEIRLWDKDVSYPCEFEATWEPYCK